MKVGIFVAIALVLVAALMVNFSKGLSIFTSTYRIFLKTSSVAGIRPQASVMMSGVEVGKVIDAQLSEDGKFVTVSLKIYSRYKIYSDAEFGIDALGFLGDQYIAIRPTKNEGHIVINDETVEAQEPFNLQEMAKASVGFIQRLDLMIKKLNEIVTRVDSVVLNDTNLTNLSTSISNFKTASENAVSAVNSLSVLINTNSPGISTTLSNLVQFSTRLDKIGGDLDQIINTNGIEITVAVKNFQSASRDIKELTAELQAGKGLVGGLLKDESMRTEFSTLLTNVNSAAAHFSALGSNATQQGLWRILWKPKAPKTNSPPQKKSK